MIVVVTDAYSDVDLQDPGSYYGGFKESLVTRLGVAERLLSHQVTGEYRGSSFTFSVADDLRFRQQLAGPAGRYWSEPVAVRLTTRAQRALLGQPYTAFVGPIIDAQPTSPLGWDVTLGDIVSQGLLSDEMQVPWRMIGDGMLHLLSVVSEDLDRSAPEPIIYGQHLRIPEVSPPSQHGFMVVPTYLGIEPLTGADFHVWMVCGHAVADIPDVNLVDADGVYASAVPDEGTAWLFPHHAGFLAEFGAPYRDIRSAVYGVDRRYTLIYGLVGSADPDAVAAGALTLAVSVEGVEPAGDGTGEVIVDRIAQYQHFMVNYVANAGPMSYQSGPWLANPDWNLFDELVPIVDENSFLAATLIAEERLPASGSPPTIAGYYGAAVIGATAGDRSGVRRWIAEWNRSCALRLGVTNKGQLRVVMLHPTAAIKAAAPLLTDVYEIVRGSFRTDVGWAAQANRVPFRADYSQVLGRWETVDVAEAQDAIHDYGRAMVGEVREYPFAPGITAAYHLAALEVRIFKHPPRVVTLEGSVTSAVAALDLGDYVRTQHFAAVANAPAEIRLGQIVGHAIDVGARRARADILDCEDLIDYDVADALPDAGSPPNETCATALVVSEAAAAAGYSIEMDTTAHALDPSATGFGGSGEAHHAAWWTYTPTSGQQGHVTTGTSDYDTQLVVYSGACGSLSLVDFNDNDGVMQSSFIELSALNPGTTYYFLACGYGAGDSGRLVFTLFTEPLA